MIAKPLHAALLLTTLLVLSACGGNSNNTAPDDDSSSEPPVQPESITDPAEAAPEATGQDDEELDTEVQGTEEQGDQEQADNSPTETPDTDSNLNDTAQFAARTTDPLWRVCGAGVGLDSRDSWQRQQLGPDIYRDCIKACPTNDDFIPDPNFPGLGWDNRLRTACAVIENAEADVYSAVPLYLPDQEPSRQSFFNIGAFQLHAGGGNWQCAHQQRNLSSEPFTDTGTQITYRFYSDDQVDVRNSSTGVLTTDRWWFDAWSDTRILGLPTGSTDESVIPERYVGNVQIDANRMTIYRTTVDRLLCTTERAATTVARFPESIDQINSLTVLPVDQLLNRPMYCQPFESVLITLDAVGVTQTGYHSNLEDAAEAVFIEINQSASVDMTGNTRYEFQNDSQTSYSVSDDGVFDSTFRIAGEVTRSFAFNLVDFRQFNNELIMVDQYATGSSGSSSRSLTYSLCSEEL
jgi:hypothetical protein